MEHFFPRIQVDTYAQMYTKVKLKHQRGDADVDHTQTIGGIYPPRVLAPLPASTTALQVIEAHRLFYLVKVIDYEIALP